MTPSAILQKIQSCDTDNPFFPSSGAHPAPLHRTTSISMKVLPNLSNFLQNYKNG